MAKQDTYSPAAGSYAQALIELAGDDQDAQRLGDQLSALAQAIASDQMVRSFFADPSITPQDRWQVIQKAFGQGGDQLFMNFLGVLNQKGRLSLVGEIELAYSEMLDRRLNRVRVQVTVPSALGESELDAVRQRISSALGKTAIVEQKVDQSIIGGLVLHVGDKVIDGSVRAQLEAMRKQLLASRAAMAH